MEENEEEFVVLSQVRSGHKREFEFALRSQFSIAGSLGPTRPRRHSKLGPGPPLPPPESEPESDVVDVVSSDDGESGSASVTGCDETVVTKKKKEKKPRKVKELLETGLLEGLHVTYVRWLKKPEWNKGLAGIIRGTGILCFCDDCKGTQVIKPNEFELHAGSLNKRPADYTFLDNGKSLRDVLTACLAANQDALETTILNAVGSSSAKRSTFCNGCNGPISESAIGSKMLLCGSCAESGASPLTPTPIELIDDSGERPGKSVAQRTSSSTASKASSLSSKSMGKITRRDLRLHKLVFQDEFLPDGTEVGYYVGGKKLLTGYKKGSGIFCDCCKEQISPSQFEAHAGHSSRRKPYLNIFTSNGASLHELSLTLSRTSKICTDENDDLCSICADAGDLLCCDSCPRAFHMECISLPSIPEDDWFCDYCEDMYQKEKFAENNPNAIAAGRVPGIDLVQQITNRCIRILKTLDTQDGGGCALCRCLDYSTSGFGPRTVIICDQCEKEYHVGCLREHKMHSLKEVPDGDWLCSSECERIHSTLRDLVEHGEKELPTHLVNVVKKKHMERGLIGDDLDIRWRVFNRRVSCLDEIRSMLSKAVSVFHEQFDPIFYGDLKQDLIPHLVYGRDLKNREFGGMFCAVLSVNSTIVSAGVFRVFGSEVAEVPLVATCKDSEGKGYFQCLHSCIEGLLQDLSVKNILLPAAEEVTSLWTNRFGYKIMPQEEFNKLRKCYALMIFEGTSMLYKPVPRSST